MVQPRAATPEPRVLTVVETCRGMQMISRTCSRAEDVSIKVHCTIRGFIIGRWRPVAFASDLLMYHSGDTTSPPNDRERLSLWVIFTAHDRCARLREAHKANIQFRAPMTTLAVFPVLPLAQSTLDSAFVLLQENPGCICSRCIASSELLWEAHHDTRTNCTSQG
jgi:hypothetical protein